MPELKKGRARERYKKLESKRQGFLDNARDCSYLTIPSLFPPEGLSHGEQLYVPYQSMGARGVSHLASKLLLTLFPPNQPYMRYRVDEFQLPNQTGEQTGETQDLLTEIQSALSKVERRIEKETEIAGDRTVIFEGLKHLLVGGNVLFFDDEEADGLRLFHLDSYVVVRSPEGKELEIIVTEKVSPLALDPEFLDTLKQNGLYTESKDPEGNNIDTDTTLELYTHLERTPKNWTVYQEVEGYVIPESEGTYPLDSCPWMPIRLIRVDGEDYGRSHVEEYLGDLKSLEGLMKAIVEGSALASRAYIFVEPNGTTDVNVLNKAKNGDVMQGRADDVSVFQLEKYHDFKTAQEVIETIHRRLSYAFLLNTAVTRDAERVTAQEIRYMAKELEDALGGMYSLLAFDFQLRYVKAKMRRLQKKGSLPTLPDEMVEPTIVTGFDALGRGEDREKLVFFIGTLAEALGPEALQMFLNVPNFIERLATADGIETEGLIKDEQQVMAEQQRQQQQQQMKELVEKLGPKAMDIAGQQGQQPNQGGGEATNE